MNKKRKNPSFRERSPILFNVIIYIALIAATATIAHFAMLWGTRHSARRTVPNLVGIPLDEAMSLAKKSDLELVINDSLFVTTHDGGVVLDQLPASGVGVKPNRTIYITINAFNKKRVKIPYVAGRSLRQAKNMLETAGFEIKRLDYQEDMATNYVLEQQFNNKPILRTSDVMAEMGSGVTLKVGVEPSRNISNIPMVVGMSPKQGKSRLWESGFNVGRIHLDKGIDRTNIDRAYIYRQSIAPELSYALGTDVDIYLTLDLKQAEKAQKQAISDAEQAIKQREEEQHRIDSIANSNVMEEQEDSFFQ